MRWILFYRELESYTR